jgi:hypothetical protein
MTPRSSATVIWAWTASGRNSGGRISCPWASRRRVRYLVGDHAFGGLRIDHRLGVDLEAFFADRLAHVLELALVRAARVDHRLRQRFDEQLRVAHAGGDCHRVRQRQQAVLAIDHHRTVDQQAADAGLQSDAAVVGLVDLAVELRVDLAGEAAHAGDGIGDHHQREAAGRKPSRLQRARLAHQQHRHALLEMQRLDRPAQVVHGVEVADVDADQAITGPIGRIQPLGQLGQQATVVEQSGGHVLAGLKGHTRQCLAAIGGDGLHQQSDNDRAQHQHRSFERACHVLAGVAHLEGPNRQQQCGRHEQGHRRGALGHAHGRPGNDGKEKEQQRMTVFALAEAGQQQAAGDHEYRQHDGGGIQQRAARLVVLPGMRQPIAGPGEQGRGHQQQSQCIDQPPGDEQVRRMDHRHEPRGAQAKRRDGGIQWRRDQAAHQQEAQDRIHPIVGGFPGIELAHRSDGDDRPGGRGEQRGQREAQAFESDEGPARRAHGSRQHPDRSVAPAAGQGDRTGGPDQQSDRTFERKQACHQAAGKAERGHQQGAQHGLQARGEAGSRVGWQGRSIGW